VTPAKKAHRTVNGTRKGGSEPDQFAMSRCAGHGCWEEGRWQNERLLVQVELSRAEAYVRLPHPTTTVAHALFQLIVLGD